MNKFKNIVPENFKRLEDEFVLDLLYGYGITTKIDKLFKAQTGGFRKEYQKFIDLGVSRETESLCSKGVYTYEINISNADDNTTYISIVTPDGNDCVTIIIVKDERQAILHNMSYYDNCAIEGLRKPGSGGKLLRFTLNLILKWKDEYGINRIVLKDNSFLYCSDCSDNMSLSRLRLITHGNTWYGSYGFKPYNVNIKKPDDDLLKSIDTTVKILRDLKTDDINMLKLVTDVIKKENLTNININEVKRLIMNYPILREFITRLLKEMKRYCCVVVYILKIIYNPETRLGVTDFNGKLFYLDI